MTDLETALRNTLRERATDIDTVPVDFAHLASLDVLDRDQAHHLHRGRRTTWLIAASVVAVLAVAATVIGLGKMRSDHHVAPATERPSTPHASASPAPVQRSTCTATLPNAWRTALISGTSRFGAVSTMPLAVSPDGSAMLVARDYGSRRDVALVRGDAPARSIYSVPQPDQNQVVDASMDGGHAALDLDRLPRNANGVIPTARKVLLIDLSNGAIKQLDGVSDAEIAGAVEHKTINGSLLWNGHVYWNVKKTFASATSTIKDYDLATGETSVAGQGVGQAGSGAPTLLPTGVAFNYPQSQSVAVPRTVPADLPAAATADVNRLVTDGTAYAWVTKDHKVMSWGPERNAITTVRLPRGVLPSLQAVGGGFVFFADEADVRQRNFVLDVRTGAVAALAEMQPFGYSATGVVVGYRFVGAVKESATAAARLDTRKLPELTC